MSIAKSFVLKRSMGSFVSKSGLEICSGGLNAVFTIPEEVEEISFEFFERNGKYRVPVSIRYDYGDLEIQNENTGQLTDLVDCKAEKPLLRILKQYVGKEIFVECLYD